MQRSKILSLSTSITVWKQLESIQSLPEAIGSDWMRWLPEAVCKPREAMGSEKQRTRSNSSFSPLPVASNRFRQSIPIASGRDWIASSRFQTEMAIDDEG